MQRGLSRVVWNVYIAVSFHDEVLDSVKVVEPAEVSGGVHAWSLFISQQRVVVAIMNMLEKKKPRPNQGMSPGLPRMLDTKIHYSSMLKLFLGRESLRIRLH